jgi:hypothetical protein
MAASSTSAEIVMKSQLMKAIGVAINNVNEEEAIMANIERKRKKAAMALA